MQFGERGAGRLNRGGDLDIAARALRGVRPQAALGRTLRALAVDLVAEVRRLDRRISAVAEPTSWCNS
ncbi:hypothetical protein HUT06_37480 [Actinomadura sp. NAK00032]|uniref:hypothetical protein n=1 Tax=Actinomadura sp. NAK00032 TaxID=2742128 RepID=UPI0015926771|nr:hypothetical protein [Actinomadura sp. NAK00032]QKW39018.1 hypothetical protein HUT06_37480 [Actinomadura sp. NAK00032]